MTHIIKILVFAGVVMLAWPAVQAGGKKKSFENTPDEVKLFELTNAERVKEKLPALQLSLALSKIARAHSENMARQEKMEHTLDKKTPFDRMRDAGYKFMKGGENIAMGDVEAAMTLIMKAWMESKGHRENILLREFTEIGIGIHRKEGQLYYTQLFARPKKK